MDITIERATDADIDAVERLYCDVNNHLSETVNYAGWIVGEYPTRRDAENAHAEGSLYVVRSPRGMAGAVVLNQKPAEAYFAAPWKAGCDWPEVLIVHTLAVHPDFRKCGIGAAILEYAEGLARKSGMRAVRLDSYRTNEPAFRLYERCGYTFIGMADLGMRDIGRDWFRLYEKAV